MQLRNTTLMLHQKMRNPLVQRKGNFNLITVSPVKGNAKLKQIRWGAGIQMEVGTKEDRGMPHGGLTPILDGLTIIKVSHPHCSSRIMHTLQRGSPTGQEKVKRGNCNWGTGIKTILIGEIGIRTTQGAPMCHLTREITRGTIRIPNRIIKGIKGPAISTTTIKEIKGTIGRTRGRTKVKDRILINSTPGHKGVWMTWSTT